MIGEEDCPSHGRAALRTVFGVHVLSNGVVYDIRKRLVIRQDTVDMDNAGGYEWKHGAPWTSFRTMRQKAQGTGGSKLGTVLERKLKMEHTRGNEALRHLAGREAHREWSTPLMQGQLRSRQGRTSRGHRRRGPEYRHESEGHESGGRICADEHSRPGGPFSQHLLQMLQMREGSRRARPSPSRRVRYNTIARRLETGAALGRGLRRRLRAMQWP
jgi:hypothetical protein